MPIRCPHCQNRVELVDVPDFQSIDCPSCGSQSRRRFLGKLTAGSIAAGLASGRRCRTSAGADDDKNLMASGVGDVTTPTFFRQDIGTAPGRMHEPTAGTDGNIWTSPLDGRLWQYNTRSGETSIHNLQQLTGRKWNGIHLWPVSYGDLVYLCTPNFDRLFVWDRQANRVTSHAFPHENPAVYGGFLHPAGKHLYFYDTRHSSVLKWDPEKQVGENFPCPYRLSNTLYMTFVEPTRQEIWGSCWNGNDIVRFNLETNKWTGHYKCPLDRAMPTACGRLFGDTLYINDHLNGRIFPFDVNREKWGGPIPVPGYRDWFGYMSGGWHFCDLFYMCHSTWTGGMESLDGKPHHFIGSWTVFDPKTQGFSRLDLPTREGEDRCYLMSDYCAVSDNNLYLLAVNQNAPRTVIVLQTKPNA